MTELVRTMQLGQATISIIEIGEIYLPMAKHMNIPDNILKDNPHGITEQKRIPLLFCHVKLPYTSVLVDAGVYDVVSEPVYAIEGYEPPAGLIEQLATLNIPPESIEHVIITHRHWDHFNGTTVEQDGAYIPQFPNATYYLGREDWEHANEKLQNPESVESRTLKVLYEHDVLTLIDSPTDIAEGVRIIPTPGETRGHQIVRFDLKGEVLYCLGDLYHHTVEFIDPTWAVS